MRITFVIMLLLRYNYRHLNPSKVRILFVILSFCGFIPCSKTELDCYVGISPEYHKVSVYEINPPNPDLEVVDFIGLENYTIDFHPCT